MQGPKYYQAPKYLVIHQELPEQANPNHGAMFIMD